MIVRSCVVLALFTCFSRIVVGQHIDLDVGAVNFRAELPAEMLLKPAGINHLRLDVRSVKNPWLMPLTRLPLASAAIRTSILSKDALCSMPIVSMKKGYKCKIDADVLNRSNKISVRLIDGDSNRVMFSEVYTIDAGEADTGTGYSVFNPNQDLEDAEIGLSKTKNRILKLTGLLGVIVAAARMAPEIKLGDVVIHIDRIESAYSYLLELSQSLSSRLKAAQTYLKKTKHEVKEKEEEGGGGFFLIVAAIGGVAMLAMSGKGKAMNHLVQKKNKKADPQMV